MDYGDRLVSEAATEPFFNESVKAHVFAPVGGRATIECRVGNLGESAVNPSRFDLYSHGFGIRNWERGEAEMGGGGIIPGF